MNLFNIYYINFPKVYEIKMMFSNIVSKGKEVTTDKAIEGDVDIKTQMGAKFFNLFNVGGDIGGGIKGSDSKKVLETFEVKTTKSVILNDVVERCQSISSFEGVTEGQLIMIDNVKLSLENEGELRTIKLFQSGAFKDMSVPGVNGFDFTNLFNSMFKDYAYKIKGSLNDKPESILIKIPLTFENEFESSYSVDDLFVGKVSILGLYKGKITIDELKNSFQFFQELGSLQNTIAKTSSSEDDEIQDSQYPRNEVNTYEFTSSGDGKDYHYIDLLGIIQKVNIPN